MKIAVRVVPNAKAFRLEESEKGFRVYVDAKAEGNRANIALQKGLGKLIGKKVFLHSGGKSRDKVLEIEGSEKEAIDALRKACTSARAR